MAVYKRKDADQSRKPWVAKYKDAAGKWRTPGFRTKKEADAEYAKNTTEVRAGTHIADATSITVKQAGVAWLAECEATGLEKSTTEQYRVHLHNHIAPAPVADVKLSRLSIADVRAYETWLRENGRSPAMVRKVRASLGSIVAYAMECGQASRNVVRDAKRHRGRRGATAEKRAKGKLQVGVDIPSLNEIKAILAALSGSYRPLLMTAIFTGLRASELRGLRWEDVDLAHNELHVRQRADRYNEIGAPKSAAGSRVVPLPALVVNTLKEWKLACPKGELGLVFPNGAGKVESLGNIWNRGLTPAQVAAGVSVDTGKVDDKGKPIMAGKYGMHALRHFYASLCINRTEDGGLGLPLHVVKERMGHSSIQMTSDTYGHLFPRADDGVELGEAAARLLA